MKAKPIQIINKNDYLLIPYLYTEVKRKEYE